MFIFINLYVSGDSASIIRRNNRIYATLGTCYSVWMTVWYAYQRVIHTYVEIKCQQRFLLQILLLAQHVSGTTMPIIRSSRVLYSGCCLWYLVLWFSSCWSGVELRVMCPVCRMLVYQHEIPQAATTV